MLDLLIAIRLIRLIRLINETNTYPPCLKQLKMVEINDGIQSVLEKDDLIATNCN